MIQERNILTIQPFDVHVHDRGLEQSSVATPESESRAAAAGGWIGYLAMPNTKPALIDSASLARKLREADHTSHVYYGAFVAGVHGNQEEAQKAAPFACAMKLYMNNTTGGLLIDNPRELHAHFAAWQSEKPICAHAEAKDGALKMAIDLCRIYKRKTHICHVSKKREIEMIKAAKQEGLPLTCEVTPHHLFLTEHDQKAYLGPLGLMKPELGTKKDQDALWKNLEFIDCLATDHAPHKLEDKRSANPPYGVPGLETALPLMLKAVAQRRLTIEKLISMVETRPREIFGLPCFSKKSTYARIDLEQSYYIDSNQLLYTACGWTPFTGFEVKGRVREVCVAGQVVFRDGEIVEPHRFGNQSLLIYQSKKNDR